MEDGGWRSEDGGWKMEEGGMRAEEGRWRNEDTGRRNHGLRSSHHAPRSSFLASLLPGGLVGGDELIPLGASRSVRSHKFVPAFAAVG